MKTTAIILFILTYVLLLSLPKIRAYIALTSAAIFVFLGILPLDKVIAAIDWNVILMIAEQWEWSDSSLNLRCPLCWLTRLLIGCRM